MTHCAGTARLAILIAAIAGTVGINQVQASSFTVATFADPSPGSEMPLFEFSADVLSGGWSGTGLTLETLVGDFDDVTFTMTDTTVVPVGGGVLQFFDSMSDLLLKIEFDSSSFSPIGFGSSDPTGVVTMSGPVIEVGFGVLSIGGEETFSFAFANQVGTPADFTTTAAFTSSTTSTPIPEPVSLMLLAGGAGFVMLRRRQIKIKGGKNNG
ncbi:MAG: PEP-CTERM sorting domain-containing protein [Planctomycetes bacterium]|nr:PEP-CTERM sorting domain-containing protein [Planctomycetota bacterium]